jgi:hypothetical protein
MEKPDFSKLDPESMYPVLLQFGLQTSGDHAIHAERLFEYFADRKDLSGPCDNCGACSPNLLAVCPFCGVGEEAPPVASVLAGAVPLPPPKTLKEKPMTTSITKSAPDTVQTASVKLLDQAVADIKRIQATLGANSWALAVKLTQVNESEIWKTRRNEVGTVAYKTFEQFTKAEVGFGRKQAQDLMRIQANFTEQEVSDYGSSKLRLVLQAAPEMKSRLLGRIKAGASTKEVEQEARKNPADPKKSHAQKRSKKPVATNAITVAQIEGKKIVRAYAKPSGKKDAELVPATKISDVPWGHIDLANDVRLFISLIAAPSGELSFRLDFKRNEK